MNVRQGALERSGFKLLYLYNELAALRNHTRSSAVQAPPQVLPESAPLNVALRRQNNLINVFAICPLKSFVLETIDTNELWNSKGAGIAFEVMQKATGSLLNGYQFKPQDKVREALVSRAGHISWDENF